MSILLYGKPVAEALTAQVRETACALAAGGVVPCLALVRVGEREDSAAYERAAVSRCGRCGIEARRVILPTETPLGELRDTLAELSADPGVHGILPLRPLPDSRASDGSGAEGEASGAALWDAIAPEKDVDGVTRRSMASVYAGGGEGFAPCTAEACLALLRYYGVPLAGRRAVVVGRSLVVGRPLALLLLRENATVTLAHSRTEGLEELCREAEVLAAAAGRPGLIGREHLRQGQTVLDVGIHPTAEGGLCGDVRFAEAEPLVRAITPVPGGVGTVTTALLCRHTVEAAERQISCR